MSDESRPQDVEDGHEQTTPISRSVSRDDLRRFFTVTVVLIAMLFLALGLKQRRDQKRQGFDVQKSDTVTAPQKQSGHREIGRFRLLISDLDRRDAAGETLNNVADMVIQDRSNYHQGIHRDDVDENDSFFNTPRRRKFWRTRIEVHPNVTVEGINQPLLVQLFQNRVVVTLAGQSTDQ